MAQAARTLQQNHVEPRYRRVPDIHVIPGRSNRPQTQVDPTFRAIVTAVLAAFLFVAIIGVVRVWFISSTCAVSISSEETLAQIETARATGNELEVQQAVLSNPTRVETYAKDTLGMVQAVPTSVIDLSTGAVSVTSDGSLSISGTVDTLGGAPAQVAADSTQTQTDQAQTASAEDPTQVPDGSQTNEM